MVYVQLVGPSMGSQYGDPICRIIKKNISCLFGLTMSVFEDLKAVHTALTVNIVY